MKLSIIIPVLDEEENLSELIPQLSAELRDEDEILVIDASTNTVSTCFDSLFVKRFDVCLASRAYQMNYGGKRAHGDVFYFVHADTRPPKGFRQDIEKAINQGHQYGCYPFVFDSPKWYLKINSFATRFNFLFCRGGDQSLFVSKKFFNRLNGYDEDFVVMEDYDFLKRAAKRADIYIMREKRIRVSARKYALNPYWKVNWANFTAVRMFKRGIPAEKIKQRYQQLLRQETKRY